MQPFNTHTHMKHIKFLSSYHLNYILIIMVRRYPIRIIKKIQTINILCLTYLYLMTKQFPLLLLPFVCEKWQKLLSSPYKEKRVSKFIKVPSSFRPCNEWLVRSVIKISFFVSLYSLLVRTQKKSIISYKYVYFNIIIDKSEHTHVIYVEKIGGFPSLYLICIMFPPLFIAFVSIDIK